MNNSDVSQCIFRTDPDEIGRSVDSYLVSRLTFQARPSHLYRWRCE